MITMDIRTYSEKMNISTQNIYKNIEKYEIVMVDGKKHIVINESDFTSLFSLGNEETSKYQAQERIIEILESQISSSNSGTDRLLNTLEKQISILEKQLGDQATLLTSQLKDQASVIKTLQRQIEIKEQEAARLTSLVLKSKSA